MQNSLIVLSKPNDINTRIVNMKQKWAYGPNACQNMVKISDNNQSQTKRETKKKHTKKTEL